MAGAASLPQLKLSKPTLTDALVCTGGSTALSFHANAASVMRNCLMLVTGSSE
jgi:hypothetical protein